MRGVLQFVRFYAPYRRHPVVYSMLFFVTMISSFAVIEACANETTYTKMPINDVRVLIDIPGNMKKNVPANLRQPALSLVVSMLPARTQPGVWTFGQWVKMFVPHGGVTEQYNNSAKYSARMTKADDSLDKNNAEKETIAPDRNSVADNLLAYEAYEADDAEGNPTLDLSSAPVTGVEIEEIPEELVSGMVEEADANIQDNSSGDKNNENDSYDSNQNKII